MRLHKKYICHPEWVVSVNYINIAFNCHCLCTQYTLSWPCDCCNWVHYTEQFNSIQWFIHGSNVIVTLVYNLYSQSTYMVKHFDNVKIYSITTAITHAGSPHLYSIPNKKILAATYQLPSCYIAASRILATRYFNAAARYPLLCMHMVLYSQPEPLILNIAAPS